MSNRDFEHDLSPRELWPDRVFDRQEFQYPDRLNAATELLDVHVSSGRGDATAILFGDQRLSYADLQRMTDAIGHGLKRIGVRPGDRVGLRIPNRPTFVAAWLALQKIGAVCVATMPMLRARELTYVVNDCGVKAFICATDLLAELVQARDAFDHPVIIVADPARPGAGMTVDYALGELTEGAGGPLETHLGSRDDLALIAYTSGSTGRPKGSTHTTVDVLASADGYSRSILQPTPTDVFGGHPTMAFTFGLGGLLVFPLRAGATTVLMDRFSPDLLLNAITRYQITLLFCSATTYRMLLQDPNLESAHDLGSLRLCVSAGETLPGKVYEEFLRRTGVEILDGLGSTEMFHIFISARAGSVRPGATGTPVPGYEAKVVDDGFHEVGRGMQGLLAVKGPTGCRYWRNPERQRDYVRHGWNVTGDVYIEDEDGYFWYQCRADDVIICGGYNVAGPEVEGVLLEHPAVVEAAVVASPDAVRGFVPKAYVVLKPGAEPTEALASELQEHVKRQLAPYKYPREVEFVSALPRTETGKLRRIELREREQQRKAATPGSPHNPPFGTSTG